MDANEVIELKHELEEDWGQARGNMEQCLSLYDLDYGVKVEQGYPVYHPPTAPRVIDTAIDHILVGNEVISVPPRKPTKEGQEQADKLERFYTAFSHNIDKDLPEHMLRSLGRDALTFGLGVMKGPFWDEAVPDKPTRGKTERLQAYKDKVAQWEEKRRYVNPFIFRTVDPRQILYPIGAYPPPFVIEVGRKKVRYVRETYGLKLPSKKDNEWMEWVEYWTCEERCFLADGHEVLSKSAKENIGGFLPFYLVYSGLGRPSGDGSPHTLVRSILEPVRQALIQETTLLTAVDVIVQTHAYPHLVIEESAANRITWEPGPGGNVTVPDGVKLQYLELPRVLPDVYNRLSLLRREIEEATFTGVIGGSVPPGVDTGYQTALLIGQARMKFGALVDNLERAKEKILSNVGRLIENLDETLTIWAKTEKGNLDEKITASDFNGHHEVKVILSAVSPEEADRRTMLGLNLLKSGAISLETFLEKYALISDVTGEKEKMLIEKMLATPEIQQVLTQEAMRAWADEEILRAIDEAKQIQGNGQGQAETLGGGSGMPGLTPQVPGTPTRPTQPGSVGALGLYLRNLKRDGVANQAEPMTGPRGEIQ